MYWVHDWQHAGSRSQRAKMTSVFLESCYCRKILRVHSDCRSKRPIHFSFNFDTFLLHLFLIISSSHHSSSKHIVTLLCHNLRVRRSSVSKVLPGTVTCILATSKLEFIKITVSSRMLPSKKVLDGSPRDITIYTTWVPWLSISLTYILV